MRRLRNLLGTCVEELGHLNSLLNRGILAQGFYVLSFEGLELGEQSSRLLLLVAFESFLVGLSVMVKLGSCPEGLRLLVEDGSICVDWERVTLFGLAVLLIPNALLL